MGVLDDDLVKKQRDGAAIQVAGLVSIQDLRALKAKI
jgi:hypothetical protein